MQAQVRNQMLQATVLILHRPQTLRLAHFKTAVLRLPGVKRRSTDPMLPAKIGDLHSGLELLQYPNDLLFRKIGSSSYQLPPVQITRESWFSMAEISGSRSQRSSVSVRATTRATCKAPKKQAPGAAGARGLPSEVPKRLPIGVTGVSFLDREAIGFRCPWLHPSHYRKMTWSLLCGEFYH